MNYFSEIALISGNANRPLSEEISGILGIPLCDTSVVRFADGEISVTIHESVRGKDVFILQPACPPANDSLMEILILIDALKRASAGRINVVMPYYCYARQDRKEKARVPISSKLVADLISVAGADRVIACDLHADQIMGFFNIPVDRLQAMPIIAEYIMCHEYDLDNMVVVSPDVGSAKRSRALAERLGVPLAIVDKRRPKDNVAEVMNIIGDVEGKDVIMIDDMVDTAGTIVGAANALKTLGAEHIFVSCTHGLLSGPAVERIKNSAIDKFIMTNTIPLPEEKRLDKIEVVSIAPLLADVIKRVHTGDSVSELFN
ncbi:MAG: ribose-phosphate pyrophosphokinase [Anaerofustis stercorihominis]|nr:ribose-phosphate pyrophosphokinase [Anaerofustis stercorihominis]